MLAIEEGGEHAAEGLIIARYMMFMQVYCQHTRRIYDFHSSQAIKRLLCRHTEKVEDLNGFCFPAPTTSDNITSYLKWDDWRVLGMISEGHAGEHGRLLLERDHYRRVFKTSERPAPEEFERLTRLQSGLGDMPKFVDKAPASWYKFENFEIPILTHHDRSECLVPLSRLSSVVNGLKSIEQVRIYVPRERKNEARSIIDNVQRIVRSKLLRISL